MDVKDRQLHAMFISTPDSTLRADFTKLGDGDKFPWYQAHTEAFQGGMFEDHAPVCIHNDTRRVLTTMWLLLDSQSIVYLISNSKMLVSIRAVHDEDVIR